MLSWVSRRFSYSTNRSTKFGDLHGLRGVQATSALLQVVEKPNTITLSRQRSVPSIATYCLNAKSTWMSGSANAGTAAERHQMRELKILTRKVRALASAPGHVCFPLTEDLHGCRIGDLGASVERG
jgi:hypothetical protein